MICVELTRFVETSRNSSCPAPTGQSVHKKTEAHHRNAYMSAPRLTPGQHVHLGTVSHGNSIKTTWLPTDWRGWYSTGGSSAEQRKNLRREELCVVHGSRGRYSITAVRICKTTHNTLTINCMCSNVLLYSRSVMPV